MSVPCQLSAGDSPAPDLMDLESPTWQLTAPETAEKEGTLMVRRSSPLSYVS